MTDTVYPSHPILPPERPSNAASQPGANPYLGQQNNAPVPVGYPMPKLPQSFQPAPAAMPAPAPQPRNTQPQPQPPHTHAAEPSQQYLQDVTWSNFQTPPSVDTAPPQAVQYQPAQAPHPHAPPVPVNPSFQPAPPQAYPPQAYRPQDYAAQAYQAAAQNGYNQNINEDQGDDNFANEQPGSSKPKGVLARLKRKTRKKSAKIPDANVDQDVNSNAEMPQSVSALRAHIKSGPNKSNRKPFFLGLASGFLLSLLLLTLVGGASEKKEYGVVAGSNLTGSEDVKAQISSTRGPQGDVDAGKFGQDALTAVAPLPQVRQSKTPFIDAQLGS